MYELKQKKQFFKPQEFFSKFAFNQSDYDIEDDSGYQDCYVRLTRQGHDREYREYPFDKNGFENMTRIPDLFNMSEIEEVPNNIEFIFVLDKKLKQENKTFDYEINLINHKIVYEEDENGWLVFKEETDQDHMQF